MSQSEAKNSRSWRREPWPWFIIGLLGTTIIAGIVTVWIAVTNPDLLVVEEDEYQQIRSELRAQSDSEDDQPDPDDG